MTRRCSLPLACHSAEATYYDTLERECMSEGCPVVPLIITARPNILLLYFLQYVLQRVVHSVPYDYVYPLVREWTVFGHQVPPALMK